MPDLLARIASAKAILAALAQVATPEQVAAAANLPLFRVRSALCEIDHRCGRIGAAWPTRTVWAQPGPASLRFAHGPA